MRYRAKVWPLYDGHRQPGKEFWGYTNAASEEQAGRFLRIRYAYPKFAMDNPELDPGKTPAERVKEELHKSIHEEIKVAMDYEQRARLAEAAGRKDLKDLWEHVAEEEAQHMKEFQQELPVREISPEIHRKYIEGGGYVYKEREGK